MPRSGSHVLSEVRADRVEIECSECNRRGSYSTARLLEQYGPEMRIPDLKAELVTCPHLDDNLLNPCKAMFSLATRLSWGRRG